MKSTALHSPCKSMEIAGIKVNYKQKIHQNVSGFIYSNKWININK